jgi:hypothetical protein
MEHGKRRLKASEAEALAPLYGVTPSWLLGLRKSSRAKDDRADLAAQELANLGSEDLDRLLEAIQIVRRRRARSENLRSFGE